MRSDTITLVSRSQPRGVFDEDSPVTVEIPCMVRSVTRSEAYQAKSVGLDPTIVFVVNVAEDYSGQKTVKYHGQTYRVVRTYQQGFSLELVCEEATYNQESEAEDGQNQDST